MNENLARLVEFPTVTADQYANREALGYVGEFLAARGMSVYTYDFNGFQAMIGTTRPGSLEPPVMLASHMDVVDVTSPSQFEPHQVGDRLYGRGMLDMKFNIATSMDIVDDLAREGTLADYDFAIAITTEEETGGYEGTQRILELGYKPNVCILPDGGMNWQMQTSSKGFLHYSVAIVDGTTTHSSTPWNGDNAIERLIATHRDIKKLFPKKSKVGPDTNSSSLNIINGGLVVNQVPHRANMTIDARFINAEEMARLRSEIGRICLDHAATMTTLSEGDPANFSLDNKYLAPFARLVREVTGIEVTGSRTHGSSDARFFAAKDIPVISLYPTGGGHHGDNEWISETALGQFKDVVRRYLDQFARVPAA